MIVVDDSSAFLFITQADHAKLAWEVLSLWRADGFPDHPRRRQILLATREHDNGWREEDAVPDVDPQGRPYDYRSLPAPRRRRLWERGCARLAADRPYEALLITRHALALHRRHAGEEGGWHEFLERLRERFAELQEVTGAPNPQIDDDYRFLERADALALAACSRQQEPVSAPGLELRAAASTLHLRPFGLAGATTFRVAARRVPRRSYARSAELAAALATARWKWATVRLAALEPPL